MKSNIIVFGAGYWGTALAIQLSKTGNTVFLHAYESQQNLDMIKKNCNTYCYPEISFSSSLRPIANWQSVIDCCDDIVIAAPSIGFSDILLQLKPYIKQKGIISGSKGFCTSTYKFIHHFVKELFPKNNFGVITGPSFAKEVAAGLPTAVLTASYSLTYACHMKYLFSSKCFKCIVSTDVIGAELGGIVKNILAIACGISNGLGFKSNTATLIIVYGLKELNRLILCLGGLQSTINSLGVLGDTILTCSDKRSRNYYFGYLLGQGRSKDESLIVIKEVVEGVKSLKIIFKLFNKYKINSPVINAIHDIVYKNMPVKSVIYDLLYKNIDYVL